MAERAGSPRRAADAGPPRSRLLHRGARPEDLGALTSLPGVGPARERAFARLGVECVRDLLFLMPARLEVWEAPIPIEEARERQGQHVRIAGAVRRSSLLRLGGRRSVLRVSLEDGSGAMDAVFFNQPWLADRFVKGAAFELYGRVVDAKGPALAVPKVGTDKKPLPPAGATIPLYPLVEGLSQDLVRGLVRDVAERVAPTLIEPLEPEARDALDLPPLPEAVLDVHRAASVESFRRARRRLALEPLLELQARLLERRRETRAGRALSVALDDDAERELHARLPHTPTPGQVTVMGDLRADLARTVPMRRLMQGDVGSGKTLVGLYACLAVARAGGQCAFLAPTEILAEQHFDGLRPWLAASGLTGVLLTGSLPAAERRQVLAQLESGMVDVAFGTHALFSSDVRYRNLALAVIDEQHRFGVAQRARLLDKGRDVHVLLMTATPIPRTLALTLYGDLDTSVLRGRPPGRGRIRTRWVRAEKRTRLPEFLRERLAAGEQVYWVVPRIGSAEEDEDEVSQTGRSSAEHVYERLGRTPLAEHGLELVHGRVPQVERTARLQRFRDGDARVLVATTVIEVGVDVPSATVMVIENAERLGLAQLHQLRGRIGRGARESWCLLLGDQAAAERFEFLVDNADGFAIAEEDLRRRGMGDLAGLRQAGENTEGLSDPGLDLELILAARDLVARRPDVLESYAARRGTLVTP